VSLASAQRLSEKDDLAALRSYRAGIELLEKGAPRSEVLARWEAAHEAYPNSALSHALNVYTTLLRRQVEADTMPVDPVDPAKLPIPKRVAYYTSLFPDVHGRQYDSSGACYLLHNGAGTEASDAIVAIGRPAIPALIELLDDNRLTRSVGRGIGQDPTVVRVQDVAVQCIEAILKVRFLPNDLSYLSSAQPALHSKITADIRSWWKQNGSRTPLQGYLARMHDFEEAKAPVWQRVEMLEKIEALDRKAINSNALLNHWALEVRSDRDYFPVIAKELADRGDLSYVPEMRRRVREDGRNVPWEALCCVLQFGDAADYRLIAQRVRSDVRAGKTLGTSAYLDASRRTLKGTAKAAAVPVLVEIVQHRQGKGGHQVAGRGDVPEFGAHTDTMLDLIRLTGHNEGFEAHSPSAVQFAAIQRWTAWWNREGKAAFRKKHPEVK
jgi:hypothetical protein